MGKRVSNYHIKKQNRVIICKLKSIEDHARKEENEKDITTFSNIFVASIALTIAIIALAFGIGGNMGTAILLVIAFTVPMLIIIKLYEIHKKTHDND